MSEEMKILVVDDEKVIRDMLAQHLTEEGLSATAVPDGEEALELFREDPTYLVITDIRMPGMSGVKLLEEIKTLDSDAVVIIMTSHASLDNAVATLKAGAFDYIFKPFQDLDVITDVIRRGLGKMGLVHENRVLVEELEHISQKVEKSNAELKEQVVRDGLTGLFNHRHFKEVLEKEVARAARYQRSLCLIMADVDHFKSYNDTHGHPAGDVLLVTLAELITARLRTVDIPVRYGGEEFAILLPETDWRGGKIVAENLRERVESHPFEGAGTQPLGMISLSLGIAAYPGEANEAWSLLKMADEALYQAKESGRNRVVCAVGSGS